MVKTVLISSGPSKKSFPILRRGFFAEARRRAGARLNTCDGPTTQHQRKSLPPRGNEPLALTHRCSGRHRCPTLCRPHALIQSKWLIQDAERFIGRTTRYRKSRSRQQPNVHKAYGLCGFRIHGVSSGGGSSVASPRGASSIDL
jgi:hypothetical protein